ncbi:MAG: gliding motility-associated C-terminal domain-containing protein [Tenacibaculum sp.]|nr:gliding motility-associated C-terminal domain-containing protein [Tenacibaculum sp.]
MKQIIILLTSVNIKNILLISCLVVLSSIFGQNKEGSFKPYSGPIYEVPTVVHLVESSHSAWTGDNSTLKISDLEMQTYIDRINAIFATTYGNGYFPEGGGAYDGTVMPFKLVLAKRTPNGQPTNGIVHYDGDQLLGEKYGVYGIKQYLEIPGAVDRTQLYKKIPNWDGNKYYNIYIVVGIDGLKFTDKQGNGVYGFANQLGTDMFLAARAIKENSLSAMAHEVGHSFGLGHASSVSCGSYDDGIDDTENVTQYLTVKRTDINPCTGKPYNGGQYNIMGYQTQTYKFTPGQRKKAVEGMLKNKIGWLTSDGGKEPTEKDKNYDIDVVPAKSVATDVTGGGLFGAVTNHKYKLKFGSINDEFMIGDKRKDNGEFYIDRSEEVKKIANKYKQYVDTYYTNDIFKDDKKYYTTLTEGKNERLVVDVANDDHVHIWIDWNNDGDFDDNESILKGSEDVWNPKGGSSIEVTIPKNAVKNENLRMRVLVGDYAPNPNKKILEDGAMIDYLVKVVSSCTQEAKRSKPVTKCWETAVFNETTCNWDVTGAKPSKPVTKCWQTAVFNETTCNWDVTGAKPSEPVTKCWETAVFNETTCNWDVTGAKPSKPVTKCWETAVFNETTCNWDITGAKPSKPVTKCWQTAVFNETTCSWDITGEKPLEPVTKCWQTAVFNETTCNWDVTGAKPSEPVTKCWQTVVFNETTCSWDITGEKPSEPVTKCWETVVFNETICQWDVKGNKPIKEPGEDVIWNEKTCQWDKMDVKEIDVKVYNLINLNGINNYLHILGIEKYKNKIVIFNRYGNIVYTAENYNNTSVRFEGYSGGKGVRAVAVGSSKLPTGTYFYLLDIEDGTHILKGWIYIN